MYDQGLNKCWH